MNKPRKRQRQALVLAKETIAHLTDNQLKDVNGGEGDINHRPQSGLSVCFTCSTH